MWAAVDAITPLRPGLMNTPAAYQRRYRERWLTIPGWPEQGTWKTEVSVEPRPAYLPASYGEYLACMTVPGRGWLGDGDPPNAITAYETLQPVGGRTPQEAITRLLAMHAARFDAPELTEQEILAQAELAGREEEQKLKGRKRSAGRYQTGRVKPVWKPEEHGQLRLQTADSATYHDDPETDDYAAYHSVHVLWFSAGARGTEVYLAPRYFPGRELPESCWVVAQVYSEQTTFSFESGLVKFLGCFEDQTNAQAFRDLHRAGRYSTSEDYRAFQVSRKPPHAS